MSHKTFQALKVGNKELEKEIAKKQLVRSKKK